MKPMSQFEPSIVPALRIMMQLAALIAELRQVVCNLEISIEHEEDREQIFLARQLKGRRDNLLLTISALETHLNGPISLQGAALSATL